MMLIESPSPGASLETWQEWRRRLLTMPASRREVRQAIIQADKMIEMLLRPVPPLTEEQIALFSTIETHEAFSVAGFEQRYKDIFK